VSAPLATHASPWERAATGKAARAAAPRSGFKTQLCGDAPLQLRRLRLARLVFDLIDFDETLPGPWE
jgi:hypothetical protein